VSVEGYATLGLICGAVIGVLLFQMDRQWQRMLTGAGGLVATGGTFVVAQHLLGTTDASREFAWCGGAQLVGAVVTLLILARSLKSQAKVAGANLTMADIFLGERTAVTDYYDARRRASDLTEREQTLERRESDLEERQDAADHRERDIAARAYQLEQAERAAIALDIPLRHREVLDPEMLGRLPSLVARIANLAKVCHHLTHEFSEKLKKGENSDEVFRGYLLAVCTYLAQNTAASGDVRVHARVLVAEHYRAVAAATSSGNFRRSITPIPARGSMIEASVQAGRALVKTVNVDLHWTAAHDETWEDYLTFVLSDYKNADGLPYMSFGISVRSSAYRHTLRWLSFLRIEAVVSEMFHLLDKEHDVSILAERLVRSLEAEDGDAHVDQG